MNGVTVSETKQRKLWIDALRGLAMIFVIFGHRCPGFIGYFVFTSPIKIPLFFAITGYVFNPRGGDTKIFFKNLFFKIIIPWIFLSLFPFKLLYSLLGFSSKTVFEQFYIFLSGSSLWYMPCCIIAEIIHFFVRKFCKQMRLIYSVSILIMITGVLLSQHHIGKFANFNTACIAQGFLAVGLFIREFSRDLNERKRYILILSFVVIYVILGLLTLHFYPGKCMDVHLNYYYDYIICSLMIIIGLICVFLLFEFIFEFKKMKILTFIGQNTLVYYMLNAKVYLVFQKFLKICHLSLEEGPAGWFITTIVLCVGCGIISVILNKYVPFLVGKGKLKKII